MFDLNELEQFIAFADLGTLSKVSEQFHISTPTITRSMQHVEDAFGVPLFSRSKNKIKLNETGHKAVQCAKAILDETVRAKREVKEFDQHLKTIIVKSCAPAPLWRLLPSLSRTFPEMTISSHICPLAEILTDLREKKCDVAILPFEFQDSSWHVSPYMEEHLSICIKKEHELAHHKQVSFSDINGFNFLLRSKIGFWDSMCRDKMSSSKFLVQTNDFEFNELVENSSLPCFSTDVALANGMSYPDRISIPITDSEANVTFYLITSVTMINFLPTPATT